MARNRKPYPAPGKAGRNPNQSADNSGKLRIIAGHWRGRVLRFPGLDGLRPTGDRVRETLFNWLQGDIHQARCLDLFAGSGALGLEALSRGAEHCTFIDNQTSACRALNDNLDLLGCSNGRVISGSSLDWLANVPSSEQPFDIIFCDPPFAADLWAKTLRLLTDFPGLAAGCLIYVETPKNTTLDAPQNWQLQKVKEAGQIRFCLFRVNG